jgi:Zinc knuckle
MDVDTIRTAPLTEEMKKKLQAKGRCYHCQKQGHMSHNCPAKKKKPEQKGTQRTATHVGEVAEEKTLITEELKAGLMALSATEKDKFINDMVLQGHQNVPSDSSDSATQDF